MPFTIAHYRERFPDCTIIIYDNFSTDSTRDIAIKLGCEVRTFWTNNRLSDQAFIDVKNNCWKDAKTKWVIVCDTDELIDVWPKDLEAQQAAILYTEYIDMIQVDDQEDPSKMNYGIYLPVLGKFLCFNKDKVQAMNYSYGCHTAEPYGDISISDKVFMIYHYKWISLKYVIKRHKEFAKRLSDHNKRNKLSFHYKFPEWKLKRQFNQNRKLAKKINK